MVYKIEKVISRRFTGQTEQAEEYGSCLHGHTGALGDGVGDTGTCLYTHDHLQHVRAFLTILTK